MAGSKRGRNRYREMESIMVKVLVCDAVFFLLYMFAAGRVGGWAAIKVISAVLSILISVLGIAWLYLTRELTRRRSLWMVTACVSILACILVSLCLGYPCPPVVAVS
jgi:hypothetical protein